MIRSNLNWNGDEVHRQVINVGWEGIQRATVYFWQQVQIAVGVANPFKIIKQRTRTTVSGKRGSQYTTYTQGAKPPNPPFKRTGFGQRHVSYELNKEGLASRVGLMPNARYMLILHVRGNDWLLGTLRKVWPQLQALATGGKK